MSFLSSIKPSQIPSIYNVLKLNQKNSLDSTQIKISQAIKVHLGDITQIEVGAIVNAANSQLLPGGGVCGAIFRKAGQKELIKACQRLDYCEVGNIKVTEGFNLPSRYIFHTVGPQGKNPKLLESCYRKCFSKMYNLNLSSIAFPCISTGIYGYPQLDAAQVAIETIIESLIDLDSLDTIEEVNIVFTCFLKEDFDIYISLLKGYFE